jgi:predicted nucleotidyltransferase
VLDSIFSKTKRRLLALLFLNPDKQYYLTEIARLCGVSQGALHREIKPLVGDGILRTEKQGKQVYYSVNKSNPIYPELRGIVYKTSGISDALTTALMPLRRKIKAAFIYGSIPKGEEDAESDIDLMVIGRVDFGDVALMAAKAEESIGREINPNVYSPEEFEKKIKSKNHFLTSVMKSPKIMLIGREDDVRKLV